MEKLNATAASLLGFLTEGPSTGWDLTNDPEFGGKEIGHRCTVCHAATADE